MGQTAAEEQKVVLDWAKETDSLWFEPKDWLDDEYGESNLGGTESGVWYDSDRNVAIKNITKKHYASIGKLLNRVLIHNMAFPDTAMTLQKVYNLLNFIENEYEQGNLNAEQLSSVGAGISKISRLTSRRVLETAQRIAQQVSQNARDKEGRKRPS